MVTMKYTVSEAFKILLDQSDFALHHEYANCEVLFIDGAYCAALYVHRECADKEKDCLRIVLTIIDAWNETARLPAITKIHVSLFAWYERNEEAFLERNSFKNN